MSSARGARRIVVHASAAGHDESAAALIITPSPLAARRACLKDQVFYAVHDVSSSMRSRPPCESAAALIITPSPLAARRACLKDQVFYAVHDVSSSMRPRPAMRIGRRVDHHAQPRSRRAVHVSKTR
ncbi:hypothetical protein [Nannocystis pusilla]|uniref:hypothetical protein n=1 Tax=Nannocystis pusilla TaxID=889268 RepID=UPI003DA49EB4